MSATEVILNEDKWFNRFFRYKELAEKEDRGKSLTKVLEEAAEKEPYWENRLMIIIELARRGVDVSRFAEEDPHPQVQEVAKKCDRIETCILQEEYRDGTVFGKIDS